MMNNINLHGRHPKDLPDKETINDILLELQDTKKFHIKWINLDNMGWCVNNKIFHNWLERGEVITCEMDKPFTQITYSEDMPMSQITVKETRYDILRHPIRLEVRFEADILSLNHSLMLELIRTSNDVYLRLKDYLGPDVIQSESRTPNFVIDFMITSSKVK